MDREHGGGYRNRSRRPEVTSTFLRLINYPKRSSEQQLRHQRDPDTNSGDIQTIFKMICLEAQLVMNGLYCGDASGYRDPRRTDLERACEEWRLLLQLDSDETAKLMWGDLGMLYFWVRQSDLSRGDLSSAWMTLQCG